MSHGRIHNKKEACVISADTFRRLYLLNVVAGFARGSYGAKRLHKITYISERENGKLRPFEFKKYHYGQYSDTMEEIKDQLLSLGLVSAIPLNSRVSIKFRLPDDKVIELVEGGTRYAISDPEAMGYFTQAFKRISPDGLTAIRSAIETYGYLSEQELLERCYAFPEFKKAEFEDTLIDTSLPDNLETPKLSDEECEELEMALNPSFISSMKQIVDGIDKSTLNLEQVKKVEAPI